MHQFGWLSERGDNFLNLLQKKGGTQKGGGGPTLQETINMFGKNTGVFVQITAEQPKALLTQCQGHSLNLGIKTTMTNSKQMKDILRTITEIILLVKYPPKRESLLGNIKDLIYFESLHTDYEIKVVPTLNKLFATRWTVCGNVCKKIDSNYLLLMKRCVISYW